jgi:hypothetical protein
MEEELKNRSAGHQHAPGEEHADGAAMPAATDTAATDTAAAAPAHTHAPGTPPHKD